MTETIESKQQYKGVLCLHCSQPIAVPGLVLELQRNETLHGDRQFQVFNLRCRQCGKEKPYKISEIIEVEGVQDDPRVVKPSALRPTGRTRVANA